VRKVGVRKEGGIGREVEVRIKDGGRKVGGGRWTKEG
jgi:hypothetical protein